MTDYTALCVRERCGCEGGGKGILVQEDKSGTIACNNDQFLVITGVDCFNQTETGDKSMTICSGKDYTHLPCVAIYGKGTRPHSKEEAVIANCLNVNDIGESRTNEIVVMATQQGGAEIGIDLVCLGKVEVDLRRLTPTECGRLQGMPDWWCEDVPHSDSAEYKMWGNGMALPCVLYVMENVVKIMSKED